jgi:RHS repeat-associated protein
MLYNTDSGLYLTQYRAYDPVAGRWLSRDPTGEQSDALGNLYAYVGGNPVGYRDPSGKNATAVWGAEGGAFVCGPPCAVAGGVIGLGAGYLAAYGLNKLLNNQAAPPVPPPALPGGWDGTTPPAPGWTWRGPDAPGGNHGAWVSPDGSQSLHPDFGHGGDIGPHTDWNDPNGGKWRIFPDGTCQPK